MPLDEEDISDDISDIAEEFEGQIVFLCFERANIFLHDIFTGVRFGWTFLMHSV